MALLDFVVYQLFFLVAIILITIYVHMKINREQTDKFNDLKKIFAFGFIGWIIAYLRIIIIQIYQILLLINAGVDISNQEAIISAPIVSTYVFNIIGPLLSGIFEEGVRYWLLMKVIGTARNRLDRKYIPILFGLSWAYSEILILTLGFIGADSLTISNLLISGYERIIATIAHVTFTYLVLYAKFTNKKTLYIAVLVHTIYNLLALVMILELGSLDNAILIIEAGLTVATILLVIFSFRYLKSIEKEFQESELEDSKYLDENIEE